MLNWRRLPCPLTYVCFYILHSNYHDSDDDDGGGDDHDDDEADDDGDGDDDNSSTALSHLQVSAFTCMLYTPSTLNQSKLKTSTNYKMPRENFHKESSHQKAHGICQFRILLIALPAYRSNLAIM